MESIELTCEKETTHARSRLILEELPQKNYYAHQDEHQL
jgi:hypothetical protein